MKSYAQYRSLVIEQRRRQQREDARRHRLVASARPAQRRPLRRAVGHSLIRLGRYVSAEHEARIQPARSR